MNKPVDMQEEGKRKMARRAENQGSAPDAGVPGDETQAGIAAKEIRPDTVQHWARQLNVPAPRLRQAIWRVGPRVDAVKRFLANSPQH